ncbi:MAG TPA: hypothetical protein VKA67_04265, partial [Verrucomicrobiae bacterium]|nr:hypothetical protein [Verrucomicrobiae bacterium]
MKTTKNQMLGKSNSRRGNKAIYLKICMLLIASLAGSNLRADTVTLYTNNFDSYTGAATNLEDWVDGCPNSDFVWPTEISVVTPRARAGSPGGMGADGVQLINWTYHSAPNAILIRPGAIMNCNIYPRGGTNYTWNFWMWTQKSGTADRDFRNSLRVQGADVNEDQTDFVVFRSRHGTTTTLSGTDGVDTVEAYNGILGTPGSGAWDILTNAATDQPIYITNGVWNHYTIVADAVNRTFIFYINGVAMSTNYCARQEELVVSGIRFQNEGNSGDDGYFAIDDVSLTVDGTFIDLTNTYTDGFESYPARTNLTDNANPQGAWIVAETDGTGVNKAYDPAKVQVVDSSVTAPHSGNQCLKLEGGQRAGVSLAWGQTPKSDVQITWWSKVPTAAEPPGDHVELRTSIYAWEDKLSSAADSGLLGYGTRNTSPVVGGPTNLISFSRLIASGNGAWLDTSAGFTPDTWEEYQLTTHVKLNTFSIVRNPGPNQTVIIDNYPFIAN